MVNNGHNVIIESSAGLASNFTDDEYVKHGANITSNIASGSVVLARKSDIYSSDDKVAKLIKKKTFGV